MKTGSLENYHSEETNIPQYYEDGSFSGDLPLVEVSSLFNVNTYVVTQVNPHGIPFVWNLKPRDNASYLEKLYFQMKTVAHNQMINGIKQLHIMGMMSDIIRLGVTFSD